MEDDEIFEEVKEGIFENTSLCMSYIPDSTEYQEALGWIWIVFVIGGVGTCLLLYCLFIEQLVFAMQNAHSVYRNSLVWLASVYPFMTLMTIIGFTIPRAQQVCFTVKVMYMLIGISKFTDLTLLMYGSEEVMLWTIKEDNVKLNKLPVFCCLTCIKPIKMTKKKLRFIIGGVQQLPYSQCFYLVMVMILQAANQVIIGSLDPAGSFLWLDFFSVTSSLMGVYFLNVLSAASYEYLKHYNYSKLSFVMSALILLTKFQTLLFSILAYYGAFPCIPPISHYVYKETVENCFYIIEMLIFGVYSYMIYRKIPFDKVNPTVVRTDVNGKTLPHYEAYIPCFDNPYPGSGLAFPTDEDLSYPGRGIVFPADDNMDNSDLRELRANEFFSNENRLAYKFSGSPDPLNDECSQVDPQNFHRTV